MSNVFDTLNAINVNDKTETKETGGSKLTYLSWSWAWAEVKKRYPEAAYEIWKDTQGRPYTYDPLTGFMVYTTVTIEGISHEMWLPVMNSANKAMKAEPYTYRVKDYRNGGTKEMTVEAATMFDVNKTIMRCLVKNLAMFGLGLYIYSGEDLPETEVQLTADENQEADINKAKTTAAKKAQEEARGKVKVTEDQIKYIETLCESKNMKGTPGYKGVFWKDMTIEQYTEAVDALKKVEVKQ